MIKKYCMVLLPCLLFIGCAKSPHVPQKQLQHLDTAYAHDSKTIDHVSVSIKSFDQADNENFFDKRSVPFTSLQLTFDNQSDTTYMFDPQEVNRTQVDTKTIANALYKHNKGAYGIMAIGPLAGLGLSGIGLCGWAAYLGTTVLYIPIFLGLIIALPLTITSITGGAIFGGIKHAKQKKQIRQELQQFMQPLYIPAGQKISTMLFTQELKPRLLISLIQAENPQTKLLFELRLPH